MSRPLDTDATGRVVNMIGKPVTAHRGSVSGVGITRKDGTAMPKAEQNGRYVLNGMYFRIRKGDALPEGAEMVEERKKDAAPENKAKAAPVENRAAKSDKKAD